MAPPAKPTKRSRDPLSPKPILDRATLLAALESSGVVLKHGQIDMFYQLLHRSNYPPLDEFVAELRGVPSRVETGVDGRRNNAVPTKNAVSSKPGKRAQLPKAFLEFLSAAATTTNDPVNEKDDDDDDKFCTLTSRVRTHRTSSDGSTTKMAVELQDGNVVESVLMRHEGSRVTICVSSQVGCKMGCTFCATGTMGIRGDLLSGEILEQLVHASRILASTHPNKEGERENDGDLKVRAAEDSTEGKENADSRNINGAPETIHGSTSGGEADDRSNRPSSRPRKKYQKEKRLDLIRNVVFMGMGEPLNNYANVLATCRAMIDRRLWNLAHNHVTVSTVGVASRMRDLTRDLPEVNLALSLHAPTQSMREKIVPSARGTPIESLIEALDAHMMALARRKNDASSGKGGEATADQVVVKFNADERKTVSKKKRAMIEYVMLVGDTSTYEAAHQLGKLCEGRHLVINLIPYNKTDVRDKLSCPSEEHLQEFRRIVCSYGSFCSIRRTMGADIAGACGQLVVEVEEEEKALRAAAPDIEDGPFGKKAETRPASVSKRRRGNDTDAKKGDGSAETSGSSGPDFAVDPWLQPLIAATAVTASCFVISSVFLILHRRKR